ncbi:MAG: hypothetical protein AAB413_02135, partial [Patescibacteria group bacterium]
MLSEFRHPPPIELTSPLPEERDRARFPKEETKLLWLPDPDGVVSADFRLAWNSAHAQEPLPPRASPLTLESLPAFLDSATDAELTLRFPACLKVSAENPSSFMETLLTRGKYTILINHLDVFIDAGLASALADRLMEAGQWDIIASNLEKFPQGSVDASLLAERLMEAGLEYAIADNLEKFLQAGVDASL